jgi:hypothetical protein
MKHVAAIVMGFLASLWPYLMSKSLPAPNPILILLAVWIASAYLLQRSAKIAAQVLSRGFLLGAAEWIAIAVVTVSAGFIVRAAIMILIAVACIAGFAVVQLWQRIKSPSAAKVH